ncbi:MAG: C_GCAxxG_C_C family protein [Bacteroidales bacterium]|nr:C_GCAxxG_C_C family protein [Bacteroidales bacterium]MBR0500518.1 C_GCAxxG_C_C family protein [Bacteroidales bacterium]
METRKHLAAEKKQQKTHNCAQAVICTYCDICGLDEKTAENVAGAFGSGMGNREGTCGSLVGAGMVLGLVTKDPVLARRRMKQVMERFRERNGATQCRMIKGIDTGIVLRDCTDCVADAAEFLEEFLPE